MRESANQREANDFFAKIGALMACMIRGTFAIDRNFLVEVDLYDEIEEGFDVSGWKDFPELTMETNAQDTREFLASVALDNEEGLRYRHRGIYYTASKDDFGDIFGWTLAEEGLVDTHSNRRTWRVLASGDDYVSGRSNASSLIRPKYFYLQKLMSHSVTGRKAGSQKPSLADMEILRGFFYEKVVPWCDILWTHWTNLSSSGAIYVGGVITHYLRQMHGSEQLTGHLIIPADLLTRAKMRSLRAIRISRQGMVKWSYREFEDEVVEEVVEEEPTPTLRRCTRAQTRTQQRDEDDEPADERPWSGAHQGAAAQQEGEAQQGSDAHHWGDAQHNFGQSYFPSAGYEQGQSSTQQGGGDMNTWMFNMTRVMEHLAPPSADLTRRPPDLWRPGQEIPSGYHIWDEMPDPTPSPPINEKWVNENWVNDSDMSSHDSDG